MKTKIIKPVKDKSENLADRLDDFFTYVAELTLFTGRFFKTLIKPPYEISQLLKQSFIVGNNSLPLVGITAFIMGLVFTMQSKPTLAKFGAESWLPAMIAVSMIREIAPVITALICAGKVGSGMGAELASMKVTEQIDAMEVSGAKPFRYLVVTRILATTLMLPVLVIFSDAIALFGSFVGVNIQGGNTSLILFYNNALQAVDFIDFLPAVMKTFFFGFAIGVVSCYQGYNSNSGTEGVGKSANSAVVISSLLIFIIDMIAVQITSVFDY
jgi:phospholipid/cholesterol/gamma-HCH transport system permease protein